MKDAKTRIAHYVAGLDPMAIYLMVKKQRHVADMIIGVQTLKDQHVNALLEPYNLDARLNVLSLIAWRELYYMQYNTKQKVNINQPT